MRKKEVRVRIHVKRVINIDLVAQCFKARVLVEASWVEPKMAHLDKEELKWDSENENGQNLLGDISSGRQPSVYILRGQIPQSRWKRLHKAVKVISKKQELSSHHVHTITSR